MGLVYSRTDSGLVLAEHGGDEAAVAHALRQHDDDLRLIRGFDGDRQCWVWKVYSYRGPDRPAVFVCGWWDQHGVPYPLSMRLLDKVQQLDPNTPVAAPDADKLNAAWKEKQRKDEDRETDNLIDEYKRREGRTYVFARSLAFAAARRRGRKKGVAYDAPQLRRWSR